MIRPTYTIPGQDRLGRKTADGGSNLFHLALCHSDCIFRCQLVFAHVPVTVTQEYPDLHTSSRPPQKIFVSPTSGQTRIFVSPGRIKRFLYRLGHERGFSYRPGALHKIFVKPHRAQAAKRGFSYHRTRSGLKRFSYRAGWRTKKIFLSLTNVTTRTPHYCGSELRNKRSPEYVMCHTVAVRGWWMGGWRESLCIKTR